MHLFAKGNIYNYNKHFKWQTFVVKCIRTITIYWKTFAAGNKIKQASLISCDQTACYMQMLVA